MNTEEKLKKIKELADAMYYAAQQLTTDTSRLHKAMEDYHQFIIHEYHKEEPVSEDLEKEILRYNDSLKLDANDSYEWDDIATNVILAARHFANWQKQQMEAYRIEHCKSLTNEQAELEETFVSSHVEKNNRIPTFIDAIEYGMEYCKQQMMNDVVECVVEGTIGRDGLARIKGDYKYQDKVKLIIIK